MGMALSTDRVRHDYPQGRMPAVKTGTGPWGDAIKYWLPRRNMRQADLARLTGIEEKTISSMARGFHTTTRKLEAVAMAFKVPLDQVLVAPNRQQANEDRKREIQEAVETALRNLDERQPPPPPSLEAQFEQAITRVERRAARVQRITKPKSKKTHRAK